MGQDANSFLDKNPGTSPLHNQHGELNYRLRFLLCWRALLRGTMTIGVWPDHVQDLLECV